MKRFGMKIALGVCLMLAGLGQTSFAKEDTILSGVKIEEVDVSGMTAAEAQKAMEDYSAQVGEKTLTLKIGEHEQQVKLSELGLGGDFQEIVQDALGIGRSGNVLKRYKDQKNLQNGGRQYYLDWSVAEDQVRSYVEENCTKYDQEARNASLTRKDGAFDFVPGQQGLVLDVDASVRQILDFMDQEWSLQDTDHELSLKTRITEPEGSQEQLAYVTDLLGSFTTSFSTSKSNRSLNVASGAAHIDGTVLYPGEEFSTYEVVAPFTEENGYAMAGSYLNGEVVDSMGGGICQVSSTLYNAVIRAELEVLERSPHSMTVHYVDLSADAAIAGTYKDFRFRNSLDYPIYIEGYTTPDKKITFKIYGKETRPDNRSISFESQVVSETPAPTVLRDDPGQPLGYRKVSNGSSGYVAELYKVVKVDGKETERIKVNKSTYRTGNRTITYGTAGDPVLSENLRAAIALQDEALANANIAPLVPPAN